MYFKVDSSTVSVIVIMIGDIEVKLDACKHEGIAVIEQINIKSIQIIVAITNPP